LHHDFCQKKTKMNALKIFLLCGIVMLQLLTSCKGQPKPNNLNEQVSKPDTNGIVGGGCDGCEIMYVGIPATLNSSDTSAGWTEKGQKLLVTGTVYNLDGRTPAQNVIVYYWQTDNDGLYSPIQGMNEKAKPHGHIRGWIKTDENGKYSIYTIRPAPYPNDVLPAHIHLSIKEPDVDNEYYPDDINFDDDKLLIPYFKKYPQENRGGSGIVRVLLNGDIQIAEHDIILGLNIPNYPKKTSENISGLNIGEDQPSFIPFHAWGPDKGTRTCPVCKYGRYHGIVYFVGNNPNWVEVKKWLTFLEQESVARSKYLKAYFVYANEKMYNQTERRKELERLGSELNLKNIALTFVPSFGDTESEVNLNKVNSNVDNTFIIYRHRSIIGKFVDLKAESENFKLVSSTLDKTKGDYFELSEPKHD
jgi:protocatechuate 3,4-dioxygenase, beta subunit